MNLWFRLIRIVVCGFFAKPVAWHDETRVYFRVWPTDLDINLHLTNSRYLALMDLGRVNLIFQSGLSRIVWRDKLAPVLASIMVRFRRPVKPFARIAVTTQVLGYDEKWMFIEHRFLSGEELMCHAVVRNVFVGKTGPVMPQLIAQEMGHLGPSPQLPDWIATWQAAEQAAARTGKTP